MRAVVMTLSCVWILSACGNQNESKVKNTSSGRNSWQFIEAATAAYASRDKSRDELLSARNTIYQLMQESKAELGKTPFEIAELYIRTFPFEAKHYISNLDDSNFTVNGIPYRPGDSGVADWVNVLREGEQAADQLLAPDVLGYEFAPYYYYKVQAKMAAALVSSSEVARQQGEITSLITLGRAAPAADDFEGGGLRRLQSELVSNRVFNSRFSPDEGNVLITNAIAAEAYPGGLQGDLICENFSMRGYIEDQICSTRTDCKAKTDITRLFTQQEVLFNFRAYLQDELIPESHRVETLDCVKSFRNHQPAAYEIFKWKVSQVPGVQKYKNSVDSNVKSWGLLTRLMPAFESYETILDAIAHDVETNEGINASLAVLKECADGGKPEEFCTTQLDKLIIDQNLTDPLQREKLNKLRNLLDSKDLNAAILNCPAADAKCAPELLKRYLSAADIKTLEEARQTMAAIKDAPANYQQWTMVSKKCEEDLIFLNQPSLQTFAQVKAKELCNKGQPEQMVDVGL